MKSKDGILAIVAPIYRSIGKDPQELVDVRPSYGGWLNALWFEIVRADGATTWISREALDGDPCQITNALWSFRDAAEIEIAERISCAKRAIARLSDDDAVSRAHAQTASTSALVNS